MHDDEVTSRQFRPAVGKFVLEMPAGLVDGSETASQAALRELHEETGYTGGQITYCLV